MTEFTYKALSGSGEEMNGTVEAHSLQAARDDLVAKGLDPIEIYEARPQFIEQHAKAEPVDTTAAYFPLYETMRLYAGWLLAWYCLVYAVGSYQFLKPVPIHIPYAESLFLSPLVLSFTFGAYLFLLLSGIYKAAGKKRSVALVLLLVGIGLFTLYRVQLR